MVVRTAAEAGGRSPDKGPRLRLGNRLFVPAGLVAIIAVLSLGYLPGLMSSDTLDMCDQAVTGHYHTWHSPIAAWVWGALNLPLEVMIVSQIAGFALAVHLMLARWLRPVVALVGTGLVAAVPTTLGWLGHIGKDQWSAVALLLAIAVLARIPDTAARHRGRVLAAAFGLLWIAVATRPSTILAAAAALALSGRLRSPGPAHRRPVPLRRELVQRAAVVVGFVGVTLISQALFTRVVVQPSVRFPEQPTYQYDLAALSVRTGELLIPSSSLEPGATLEDIRQHFTLHGEAVNRLLFTPDAPVRFMITDPEIHREIRNAWLEAIRDHPLEYLRHRTAFTWALLGVSGEYTLGSVWPTESRAEDWGLNCPVRERYVPGLFSVVSWIPRTTDSWPWWRVWWMVGVLAIGTALAGWRCAEARMLCGSSMMTIVLFALLAAAPGLRYLWLVSIAASVVVLLSLRRIPGLARRPLPPGEGRAGGSAGPTGQAPDRSVGPLGLTGAVGGELAGVGRDAPVDRQGHPGDERGVR